VDENALDLAIDPSEFVEKRDDYFAHLQFWRYQGALHQRDPVCHLWDCPNVDDLMWVDHFDLMNYFVHAMSYCLMTVCHLKDDQMLVCQLKKSLMLDVMTDGQLKAEMKDVMTLP
jgi:hypothetical protein